MSGDTESTRPSQFDDLHITCKCDSRGSRREERRYVNLTKVRFKLWLQSGPIQTHLVTKCHYFGHGGCVGRQAR
jgi:hypothetical protein